MSLCVHVHRPLSSEQVVRTKLGHIKGTVPTLIAHMQTVQPICQDIVHLLLLAAYGASPAIVQK